MENQKLEIRYRVSEKNMNHAMIAYSIITILILIFFVLKKVKKRQIIINNFKINKQE